MIEMTTKVQDQPRGTTAMTIILDPKHHLAKQLHEQALAGVLLDATASKLDVYMVTVRIEVRVYAKAFDQPFSGEENPELAQSVDVLNLSVRSRNCLDRGGINTIADLVGKTELDLFRIRECGRISVREIKRSLQERGLSLKEGGPKIV